MNIQQVPNIIVRLWNSGSTLSEARTDARIIRAGLCGQLDSYWEFLEETYDGATVPMHHITGRNPTTSPFADYRSEFWGMEMGEILKQQIKIYNSTRE